MIDRETRELCGFCANGTQGVYDFATGEAGTRTCPYCDGTGLQLTPEEWWKEVGHDS